MADVINIAEIQKLSESDPEKALVVSYLGNMLYDSFAAHQPKRFKAFVDALFGDGPMPLGVQAMLVHDSDWVAGLCDDLEGEGSLRHVSSSAMKAAQLRRMGEGCFDHADELQRYKRERASADM